MDYLNFYGLEQEPFSNAPVSRFYYDSSQHGQALLRLKHAVHHMKGLAILIGGIGAGKTTLARRFLDALDEREYEAALLVIIHSGVTADWLLRRIAIQLGVEGPATDKLSLLGQLYRRLVEIHESGKKAVVLIDEAQMLASQELMEEFRGLLNLEVPERKLISFVFFGLPDIELNLQFDPPLAQRVALRVHLQPFDEKTTRQYVEHRLKIAGAERSPFEAAAYPLIHKATNGLPRLINTLCDNALFEGALSRTPVLGAAMIRTVANNLALPLEDVLERPLPIPGLPDNASSLPTQLPQPVYPGYGYPPQHGAGYPVLPSAPPPPQQYGPPNGYPPGYAPQGYAPQGSYGYAPYGMQLPPLFGAGSGQFASPFGVGPGGATPTAIPPGSIQPNYLPPAATYPPVYPGVPAGSQGYPQPGYGGPPPQQQPAPQQPAPQHPAQAPRPGPGPDGNLRTADLSRPGVRVASREATSFSTRDPQTLVNREPPTMPPPPPSLTQAGLPLAGPPPPPPPPPPPSVSASDPTSMRGALEEIDRVLTSLGKR